VKFSLGQKEKISYLTSDGEQRSNTRWLYHSPGYSNQASNAIQRLHWRMRPIDRDTEEKYGKIRYSSLSLVQEVLFCFINIFLSFPEFFKRKFLHLLHSNEAQRCTLVYPPWKNVGIPPYCITDINQAPSS
jgi:hypothetical protein